MTLNPAMSQQETDTFLSSLGAAHNPFSVQNISAQWQACKQASNGENSEQVRPPSNHTETEDIGNGENCRGRSHTPAHSPSQAYVR